MEGPRHVILAFPASCHLLPCFPLQWTAGSVEACLAPMWVLIQEENPMSCADLQAKDKGEEEESPCPAGSAKPSRAAVPRPAFAQGLTGRSWAGGCVHCSTRWDVL